MYYSSSRAHTSRNRVSVGPVHSLRAHLSALNATTDLGDHEIKSVNMERHPSKILWSTKPSKIRHFDFERSSIIRSVRGGDLQSYDGSVAVVCGDITLSLREAVQKFNPCNKFTKSCCKSSSGSKTNRCICGKERHIVLHLS